MTKRPKNCVRCGTLATRLLAACPNCGLDYPPDENSVYRKRIIEHLNSGKFPLRVHKQNVGKIRMEGGKWFDPGPPAGAADITGIVAPWGWRIEIECKVFHVVTPEQENWRDKILRAGGVHVWARYAPEKSLDDNVKRAGELVMDAVNARAAREIERVRT